MARFSDDFICYQNRPPVDERQSVRAVLWPVFVWQVYGPNLSGKSINIFERSILSLLSMKTGRRLDSTRLSEIAQWHGLEPEMVRYIIEQQLEPNGWVDANTGWLTEEGHQALQQDMPSSTGLRTGYVFQDAVDGSLFPRYANNINAIEPSNTATTPLEFSLSKGSNWPWRPTVIREKVDPKSPSRDELRHVMEATHQAQRNAWMMGHSNEFESFRQLDALKLTDRAPFNAYLWVWTYTTPALENIWAVQDPIGLHSDVQWMRNKIEGVFTSYPKISREIMQMIGIKDSNDFSSLDEALAARSEQARLEVLTEYSQADTVDGLTGLLHGWMSRKLEIETAGETNRYHDYRDLITQSSSIIEHCVRYCLERYPLKNLKIIPRQCGPKEMRKLISDAAPFLSRLQLEEVLQLRHSAVFNTAKNKQGSFRLCFAACLLSMPDYPTHPIREFVQQENLFLDAYRLSHWRDKTAHAEGGFNVSKSMSLEAADICASFLKTFFEGLSNGQK
ncbi:hypothetical protein [Shewanella algae]|uniref:hypothetical protein n=1 Tax=Shewanella algae TaxID=38313 RepID=UPI0031F5B7DA